METWSEEYMKIRKNKKRILKNYFPEDRTLHNYRPQTLKRILIIESQTSHFKVLPESVFSLCMTTTVTTVIYNRNRPALPIVKCVGWNYNVQYTYKMLVKYAMAMSIASVFIMFYLNEYHTSTFIQFSSVYAQLCSTVINLHNVVLKWFSMGSNIDLRGKRKEMLFTKEELKKHTEGSKGLYLAILGKVYDVGKGEKFYGPSGIYHFFTGM
jgi:hypothetical protein